MLPRVERMPFRLVMLLAWGSCGGFAAAPLLAQDYAEHFGLNVGLPVFNGTVWFTESVADEFSDLGVKWMRMEFIVEPGTDFIDYTDYDEVVARAAAHGIQIMGLVDYASKAYTVQADWEDDVWQDSFRDRVTEIVTHYANFTPGPIKFWEVWNEPDSLGGMSASKFGRLLSICYPAIKSADPQATVISGGLTSYSYATSLYLRDIYESSYCSTYKSSHGIYPFDILGLHPYNWTDDPDTYLEYEMNRAQRVRWRMNNKGDDYKRIWFTEYGWNSTTNSSPTAMNPGGTKSYNEALQATYCEHAYAIAQPLTYPSGAEYGPYVEKTFLFCYKDFNIGTEEYFGVVDLAGAHKPMYTAYKAMATSALQNAALTADITSCDEYPPNELAVFACDGTPFTKWACLHAADDHTLTLDLGRQYLVHEYRLAHSEMNHEPDYLNTKAFEIESAPSLTGPWTMEFAVNNTANEPVNILTYATDKELRYVRLHISDANYADGWARLPEFEVWGTPVEIPPPPPNPADVDGDGDADLADFALFAACFAGPGGTIPPAGCAPSDPVVTSWESATTVSALPVAIANDDLLEGMTGGVDTGGFHEATPGGTAGGLADLTDGIAGGGAEAVLSDFANPSIQVTYTFSGPRDISRINVFAANEVDPGDGRVFQHYDVEFSTDGGASYQPLASNVVTGTFGRGNNLPTTDPNYIGATVTSIAGAGSNPIAWDVDALRFSFHPVSNIGGVFVNTTVAFVASVIKEIDVIEHNGAPATGNIVDLDGDGDADLDDFFYFAACQTVTTNDAGNPPALPPGCE